MDSAHSASDPSTAPPAPSKVPTNSSTSGSGNGNGGSGSGKDGNQQSRARVTVVCQECKRLKLKCDRKKPCGSCVKRITTERCLYSTAATEKVDLHSVNNRLMEVEIALSALQGGVPLDFSPFTATYPPVVQGTLARIAAFQAALADGSYVPRSTTSQSNPLGHQHDHDESAASGSNRFFLSGLADSVDDYIHGLAESEGILLDEELGSRARRGEGGGLKIKEEPGWEQSGGVILPTFAPQGGSSKSTSKPKSKSTTSPPQLTTDSLMQLQPQQQDALPFLPPVGIYYGPVPGAVRPVSDFVPRHTTFENTDTAPLFYPGTPGPLHAHQRQALGTFSMKEPMSIAEIPLGLPPPAMGPPSNSSSEIPPVLSPPAVTQAVINLLPSPPISARYLTSAKDALITWPVEMGFPAGTEAWPKELKQTMGDSSSQLLGWEAFFRRSKRLYSRAEASIIAAASPSSSSGNTKSNRRSSSMADTSSTGSGSGRGKEKSSSSSKKRSHLVDLERMKAIYLASGARPPGKEPREGEPEPGDPRLPSPMKDHPAWSLSPSQPASPSISPRSPESVAPSGRHGKSRKGSVSVLPQENLPFFALLCALMAVGASSGFGGNEANLSASTSPAFFYALSQQSLNVWLEAGEPLPGGPEASEEMKKEARADYLRACLIGLRYLMGDMSTAMPALATKQNRENPNRQVILSLVGKMVNALRGWGFEEGLCAYPDGVGSGPSSAATKAPNPEQRGKAKVKEASSGTQDDEATQLIEEIRKREGEEARKRVFWDVLYYDLFVADSFGEAPLIPASCYSAPLPLIAAEFNIVPHARDPDVVMMDENNDESPRKKDTERKHEAEAERLRLERLYLVSRAQLTHLAYTVKQRISVCCGYTLDQAKKLEDDVKRWSEGLPMELLLAFKYGIIGSTAELLSMGKSVLSVDDDDSNMSRDVSPETAKSLAKTTTGKGHHKPREEDGNQRFKLSKLAVEIDVDELEGAAEGRKIPSAETSTRILGCELALMVQMLLFKIYSPFTFQPAAESSTSPASTPVAALKQLTTTAQAIIRICKILQGLRELPTKSKPPTPPPFVKSPLLSMCSVEKFVFDALLVCARVCFGVPGSETTGRNAGMRRRDSGTTEVMQSIAIGLDMLESLYKASKPEDGSSAFGFSPAKRRLVAVLQNKWAVKMAAISPQGHLKRTRSVMEERSARTLSLPLSEAFSPIEDDHDVDPYDVAITFPEEANLEGSEEPDMSPPDLPLFTVQPPPPPPPIHHHKVERTKKDDKAESRPRKSKSGKASLAGKLTQKAATEATTPGSLSSASSLDDPMARAAKFGVRARPKDELKKKLDIKFGPPQPLLTSVPRTILKDGTLGYVQDPHGEPPPQPVPQPSQPRQEAQRFPEESGQSAPLMYSEMPPKSGYDRIADGVPRHAYTPNPTMSNSYNTYTPSDAMMSLPPLGTYQENLAGFYSNPHTNDTSYGAPPHPPTPGYPSHPPTPSSAAGMPSSDYFGHHAAVQPTNDASTYGGERQQPMIYGTPMGVDNHLMKQSMHTSSYDSQAGYSNAMIGGHPGDSTAATWINSNEPSQGHSQPSTVYSEPWWKQP